MLRILHTADVHLGARHTDLGERATAQRERQFAAFARTIELALAEKVDLFLVAGDLFDSNVQPRRSVERVAADVRDLGGQLRAAGRECHAAEGALVEEAQVTTIVEGDDYTGMAMLRGMLGANTELSAHT